MESLVSSSLSLILTGEALAGPNAWGRGSHPQAQDPTGQNAKAQELEVQEHWVALVFLQDEPSRERELAIDVDTAVPSLLDALHEDTDDAERTRPQGAARGLGGVRSAHLKQILAGADRYHPQVTNLETTERFLADTIEALGHQATPDHTAPMITPAAGHKALLPLCALIGTLVGCQATHTVPQLALSAPTGAMQAEAGWVPLSSTVAVPQEAPSPDGHYENLYRRFTLGVGALVLADFDTTLQVGSSSVGAGAVIDLESSLGVDSKTTSGRLDMHYAFNRRSNLEFSYYDIRRNGTRMIENDIGFGEITIPAGPVVTRFNTQVVKLAYRHNLVADVRTLIAVSAGFHVMGIDSGLESTSFDVEENFRVTAPLPVIGFHAAYALNHKWKVAATAEFFRISMGDFKGALTDTSIRIEHDPFKHFGWGLGLNGFQMDIGVDDGDVFADVEFGYQGLMLYVRTFF